MAPAPDLKNRYSGVVHAQAECEDCDWTASERKNALANGSLHARRTGHTVQCEQVTAVTYNKKEE